MQGCSYSYLCAGKIKLEYEIINNKLINIGINTTINIKNSTFTYIFSGKIIIIINNNKNLIIIIIHKKKFFLYYYEFNLFNFLFLLFFFFVYKKIIFLTVKKIQLL